MLDKVKLDADAAILGLGKVCADAVAAVESGWEDKKLDIVPGSAILDEVYKTFGSRYEKMRDGIGVASHMTRQQIDPEVRDFIEALRSSPTPDG